MRQRINLFSDDIVIGHIMTGGGGDARSITTVNLFGQAKRI